MERESFFSPTSSSPDGLLFGQVGVGGGAVMHLYIPQPKQQGSNVNTKCQVASQGGPTVSSVVFFLSFFHLIIGPSKERDGKEEVEVDGDIWIGGFGGRRVDGSGKMEHDGWKGRIDTEGLVLQTQVFLLLDTDHLDTAILHFLPKGTLTL